LWLEDGRVLDGLAVDGRAEARFWPLAKMGVVR